MILRNIFTLKKNRFFENLESKSSLKQNFVSSIYKAFGIQFQSKILILILTLTLKKTSRRAELNKMGSKGPLWENENDY